MRLELVYMAAIEKELARRLVLVDRLAVEEEHVDPPAFEGRDGVEHVAHAQLPMQLHVDDVSPPGTHGKPDEVHRAAT